MAKLSLFCLAWLFPFLHFLTSMIKFILWLKFFYSPKAGGGHGEGFLFWEGPTGSCLVTALLSGLPGMAGVISWSSRSAWAPAPQAFHRRTLMSHRPPRIAHSARFSISYSWLRCSWTYFQKDWWTAVWYQNDWAWNPIQLMALSSKFGTGLMPGKYAALFSLIPKPSIWTTYEQVANFIQIGEKTPNKQWASNCSFQSIKLQWDTHQTSMDFFSSVRFISLKMEFLSLCRISFFFFPKKLYYQDHLAL